MTEEPEEPEFTVEEEKFEKEIKVEINKLEYYLQDMICIQMHWRNPWLIKRACVENTRA